jgi:hypothetical protein
MNSKRRKYQPLADWLAAQPEPQVTLTFAAIEQIIRDYLPPSAYGAVAWWANHPGYPQSKAWLAVGWSVEAVDPRAQAVTFVRFRLAGPREGGPRRG